MNGRKERTGRPLRVLVAEDEFLVGLMIEEHLRELGHVVAGPYTDIASLSGALGSEAFDVAVLDINLNGEKIFPIADRLRAEKRPFVLSSGYGRANIPERFQQVPILPKPYDYELLDRELRQELERHERADNSRLS